MTATITFRVSNDQQIPGSPKSISFAADTHGEAREASVKSLWYDLIDAPATQLTATVKSLREDALVAVGERLYEQGINWEGTLPEELIPDKELPLLNWLKEVEAIDPSIEITYEG